jgi:hypothetical protein
MIGLSRRRLRVSLWIAALALLFAFYSSGLSRNPPGFYLDETGLAYNAYLVAHTGAGEFGPRFPLFFQYYSDSFIQTINPTQIYLLAVVFRFFPPSILLARLFSAFCIFSGCLLLGLLAQRISGRRTIGVIVAATALLTPWFFEARGLLIESQFAPVPLALFLFTLYHVQRKESWNWIEASMLAASLALVTYSTISGRVAGPLLALGLLFFATTRQRLLSVVKTGLFYGVTLFPIAIFNWRHPGLLSKRAYEISYIRPGVPWSEIASRFIDRYLEDQSVTGLLLNGDPHPRHHVPGSGGAVFFATFILVLIGLLIVVIYRRRDPWWRFILYGLAIAIVPGAIAIHPFHGMRLMTYPVFLLIVTVPALEWLLDRGKQPIGERVAEDLFPRRARLMILFAILALTTREAYRFQTVFHREGPKRSFEFDVPYKAAYAAATKQPARPIYLEDGMWGPAYIHAFWYATLEKRPTSEFVHLKPGARPPAGSIVISSADKCQNCETLMRPGVYHVYKSL